MSCDSTNTVDEYQSITSNSQDITVPTNHTDGVMKENQSQEIIKIELHSISNDSQHVALSAFQSDGLIKDGQSQEIIKSLKLILEFCNGNNENLTDITSVINQSYPSATAVEIHECLVKAFPDLQAQQSNEQNEVYYLGIKFANGIISEDKIIQWMKQRFCEDELGSISSKTLIDIIMKEVGSVRVNRLGSYVKKCYPKAHLRRSDRIRWYCGISLPEKELTEDEIKGKIWLGDACKWLRKHVVENPLKREKCSLLYSALSQNIGKACGEKYMSAVKIVFPTVQKKNYNHQAFYEGIGFLDDSIRDQVKVLNPNNKCLMSPRLYATDEIERNTTEWLKEAVIEKDNHREKLGNFKMLLQKKLQEEITDKTALLFLRKTFQNMKYRKRRGISFIYGLEITPEFQPIDTWTEKAVTWLKQIFYEINSSILHKLQPYLDIIKDGLNCSNYVKCFELLKFAFPKIVITKTTEGRIVLGIDLVEGFRSIKNPVFDESDYYGNFKDVDCRNMLVNRSSDNMLIENINDTLESCTDATFNETISSDQNGQDQITVLARMEKKLNSMQNDNDFLKSQLSDINEQMVKTNANTNTTIGELTKEVQHLRESINHSTRQRDTLIVQLQQSLMLLSQQQYQKMIQQQLPPLSQPPVQSSSQQTPSSSSSANHDIYDTTEHMMTMQALQNLHDHGATK